MYCAVERINAFCSFYGLGGVSVNSEKALEWIIDFLDARNIPYLICGGLAARAYGAMRPLHDIDLYVPGHDYERVVRFGQDFISYGPDRWAHNDWDVDYVQFTYLGQKIEVGSSHNIRIFDSIKYTWHKETLDFDDYAIVSVLGRPVRVMSKAALINYKRLLNRVVDQADIEQILA